MKIKVEENKELSEIEILISTPIINDEVHRVVKLLETSTLNIMGKLNGENYVLTLDQIFYFEAVDNRVFAYCEKEIYEINYKLQELTELLSQTYFIQTARTIVLNIKQIKKVTTLVNGRILAVLNNGEKMIITRVYAQKFKQKLKE